jgi:hypothetical protein
MRDGGKGDSPRPMKDRQTYSDNWDKIFKEKDGSLTVNITGEITIKGENNDQERQKPTEAND